MSHATPQMRDLAKRLIACETGGRKSSGIKISTTDPIYGELRPHLVTLMGDTGFRALMSRALVRAASDVPSLHVVHVNADGTFEGLNELEAQVDAAEFLEGGIVLLAQLLGLLVAFIGENLTLRIVCNVWPKMTLDDSNRHLNWLKEHKE